VGSTEAAAAWEVVLQAVKGEARAGLVEMMEGWKVEVGLEVGQVAFLVEAVVEVGLEARRVEGLYDRRSQRSLCRARNSRIRIRGHHHHRYCHSKSHRNSCTCAMLCLAVVAETVQISRLVVRCNRCSLFPMDTLTTGTQDHRRRMSRRSQTQGTSRCTLTAEVEHQEGDFLAMEESI